MTFFHIPFVKEKYRIWTTWVLHKASDISEIIWSKKLKGTLMAELIWSKKYFFISVSNDCCWGRQPLSMNRWNAETPLLWRKAALMLTARINLWAWNSWSSSANVTTINSFNKFVNEPFLSRSPLISCTQSLSTH